jgi:adenylate cyclase class 2
MVTFFMSYLNVEIKAKCKSPDMVRAYLHANNAKFAGLDNQTDTYFRVRNGRLKLREGNIENYLIYYERENIDGPKSSVFNLIAVTEAGELKEALTRSCGIKTIVDKKREIYFIENVKFHIDEVPGLGSFVEIEAGNLLAGKTGSELEAQCRLYLYEMGIGTADLVSQSYSDMMPDKEELNG